MTNIGIRERPQCPVAKIGDLRFVYCPLSAPNILIGDLPDFMQLAAVSITYPKFSNMLVYV